MSSEFGEFVSLLASCGRHGLEQKMDGLHGAIGLCTEASEILDLYKKSIFYGKLLPPEGVLEELGDALHYIQMVCNEWGFSLDDLIATNMAKLKLRYPGGYSDDRAVKRDKDAERQVFIDFLRK